MALPATQVPPQRTTTRTCCWFCSAAASTRNRAFYSRTTRECLPLYVVSLRPELFYLLYYSLNKRSILSPKTKWISSLLPLHSAAAFYCNKSAFTTSHIIRNTREGASSCEWVSTASNEVVSGWVVVELKIVNMNGRRAVDIIMIMKVLAKWIFFLLFEARQLHLIPDFSVRGWKAMALIPRMSTRQYYLSVLQLSV